jgi:hypothetical protein
VKRWQVVFLVAAIASYFIAVAFWLGSDRRAGITGAPEGSALNTSPEGTSLAYSYMSHRKGGASLLTRSLDPAEVPANAVILRIRPQVFSIESLLAEREEEGEREQTKDTPKKKRVERRLRRVRTSEPLLSPAEEEWIERGGRLVLVIDGDYGPLRATGAMDGIGEKVFPIWPSLKQLKGANLRSITGLSRGHTLFVAGNRPVLSRLLLGRGDVIVFGSPEALSNANLRDGDGLELLGLWSEGRHVYFDEVVHGIRNDAGLLELLKRWGLGPFILLLAIAAAFRLWRNSVRIGEPERAPEDVRSEAVDLVDSLGQLYARSLRRAEMIALYRRQFVHAVSVRTHARGAELERRLRELVPGEAAPATDDAKSDMTRARFERELHEINEAFGRLDAKRR